jgi:hypothetical protein
VAEAIASVLGWCVLLFGAGALSVYVIRRARVHGVLAPVLVGVALRLAVMLIAHVGSLSLGDHGLLFLDDGTFMRGGSKLAELWRAGHTPDPSRFEILGTYQFGYQVFLGAIFTLGTTSILLGKLVNVLLGGITVLLVALLARRLLGDQAKARAAWLAALAPSLVWWSAPLLKEAVTPLLMVLGLLAVTALPRPRALAVLIAVVAALLITRAPAALALVVGAGVAVAMAVRQAEGRWLSKPLIGFGGTLVGGMVAVAVIVSQGDLHSLYRQYDFVVHTMIDQYHGGNLSHLPYDSVKSLVTPLPWVFDRGTQGWDRGLYPGVWLLICAVPLAAAGLWRLRRKPEAWALAVTSVASLTINAFTSGFVFRQRSMIEPLLLLLALGGATSWRMAARSAAAALAAAAVVAGIQSGSPLVTTAIAAGAAALLLVSRRLPSRLFEPPPDSAMVASFRASAAARSRRRRPLRLPRSKEGRRLFGSARTWTRGVTARLAAAAPPLEPKPPAVRTDPDRAGTASLLAGWTRGIRASASRLAPGQEQRSSHPTSKRSRRNEGR